MRVTKIYNKTFYSLSSMSEQNGNSNMELENKIITVLKNNPKGLAQKALLDSVPSLKVNDLMQVLNNSQGKIEFLRKGKQLVFALKESQLSNRPSDVEEKLVYEAVERAGNNGVTPNNIKFACNLPLKRVRDLLSAMEKKKMVKSVVSPSKKKVFILYGVEPSHAITGGTFYSGEEFEVEFVNVLSEQSYKYLLHAKAVAEKLSDPVSVRHASFKSLQDISNYINGLNISKVVLKTSDIQKILEALVFDGKIELSVAMTTGTENYYRVTKPLLANAALMRVPCGVCPVYEECGKNRDVSPLTCVYLKEWLDI